LVAFPSPVHCAFAELLLENAPTRLALITALAVIAVALVFALKRFF